MPSGNGDFAWYQRGEIKHSGVSMKNLEVDNSKHDTIKLYLLSEGALQRLGQHLDWECFSDGHEPPLSLSNNNHHPRLLATQKVS